MNCANAVTADFFEQVERIGGLQTITFANTATNVLIVWEEIIEIMVNHIPADLTIGGDWEGKGERTNSGRLNPRLVVSKNRGTCAAGRPFADEFSVHPHI